MHAMGTPIGVLYRCHSFNCEITGLTKFPCENVLDSRETMHG